MPGISEIMNAAVNEFARGDLERADMLCRRVTDAVPDQPDALFLQAVIARRRGDDAGADARVRRSAARRASLTRLGFDVPAVLAALTRLQDPLPLYREVMRLQPGDRESHCRVAGALLAGDQPQAVTELCRAAQRLEPGRGEVIRLLGLAQLRLGLRDEAIESLAGAARLSPDDAETHYRLAGALREAGRRREAGTHYREALRCEPGHAGAQRALVGLEAET